MLVLNEKIKLILLFVILVSICFAVFFVFNTSATQAQDPFGQEKVENVNLPKNVDLIMTIIKIINWALGFLALVAIILVIYAGYLWMTAGGNTKQVDKAKKILINALIGLVIIVLSFAIVTYVFKVLQNRIAGNGNNYGQPCSPANSCVACNVYCNSQGRTEYNPNLCHTEALCGGLPQNIFKVNTIVTSCGNPPQYNEDVHLCSSVVINFNHFVDATTIESSVNDSSLRIEDCGTDPACANPQTPSPLLNPVIYSGSLPTGSGSEWTVKGRSVSFTHQNPDADTAGQVDEYLFKPNNYYRLIIPKTISDTTGLAIDPNDGCGSGLNPIPGCTDAGTEYRWIFQTGTTLDDVPPEITSTYPISNQKDPDYPDRNVNLKPIIWVRFSEAIAPWSVGSESAIITKVEGVDPGNPDSTGTLGERIDPNNYFIDVNPQGNGFEIYDLILEPFQWYQIEVNGIQDLCNNSMAGPKIWRFQTNDTAPGVKTIYPRNGYENACPDTSVFIVFNTSMYNPANGSCAVLSQGGGYVTGGSLSPFVSRNLRVVDDYPGAPADPNDFCKTYEFLPTSVNLNVGTTYSVGVNTNLVINQQGEHLNYGDVPPANEPSQGPWHFIVKSAEECANAPVITQISPDHGTDGECITVFGRYFDPDDNGQGTGDNITFNGQGLVVASTAWTDRSIATTIPEPTGLEKDKKYPIQVSVDYGAPIGILESNEYNFRLDAGMPARGPCLWSITPSAACHEDGVSLNGIRFGPDPGVGGRSSDLNHIDFSSGSLRVPDENVKNWSNEQISLSVPLGAIDGQVAVMAGGNESNPLLFDVSCGVGRPCSGSPDMCLAFDLNCAPGLVCDELNCFCKNPPGQEFLHLVEDNRCLIDQTNGNVEVYPSPNPYPNSGNVCLNSLISARFDRFIIPSSLDLKVEKCVGPEVNPCQGVGSRVEVDGSFSVLDFNSSSSMFQFIPDQNFEPESFYVVTVNNAQGIDGSVLENPYSWVFKTYNDQSRGVCPVENVLVSPGLFYSNALGDKIDYTATPMSADCTELVVSGLTWQWASSNTGVAIVSGSTSNQETAIVQGEGRTNISAITPDDVSGRALLIVNLDSCAFNPDVCHDPNHDGIDECPGSVCDLTLDKCTPVINNLSPNQGPVGRFVTVEGCYFGSQKGNGKVNFGKQEALYPCGISWNNREIIVEVPEIDTGRYPVQVTTDYDLESNSTEFMVINDCLSGIPVPPSGAPGLCSISPQSGLEGQDVTLTGENFGEDEDSVIFTPNINTGSTLWQNDKIETEVPAGAQTGGVYVEVDECPSNSLLFEVGGAQTCDSDDETPQCQPNNNLCNDPRYPICNPNTCLCEAAPAPFVSGFEPAGTNVCRNVLISSTFDQLMDKGSLRDNIILEAHDPGGCSTALAPESSNFFKKMFYKIAKLIKKVLAQENNWCQIPGRVSSYDINNVCSIAATCEKEDGCQCQTGGRAVCLISQGESECEYKATRVDFVPDEILGNKVCNISSNCTDPNGCECVVAGEVACTIPYGDGTNSSCHYPTNYRVTIKGAPDGVKSKYGVAMAQDYSWNFTTGQEICQIDHVDVIINPPGTKKTSDYFTCAGRDDCPDDVNSGVSGNQHQYIAYAKDASVPANSLVAAYQWKENDPNDLINLSATDVNNIYLTPEPINGNAVVTVTASDPNPDDGIDYGSASASVSITNFMCENPWPSLRDFPYIDDNDYANFSLFYCRDKGAPGFDDDLPALSYPPRPVGPICRGGSADGQRCGAGNTCPDGGICVLREYLLLRDDESTDAIGVRIFDNPDHLSPYTWYDSQNWLAKGSPGGLQVDDYEAIRDGRSVYVAATTLADNNPPEELHTNIYLISYNENASAETVEIYNKLLANWTFNINISDKDDKSKLIRDTKRITDLSAIRKYLIDYYNTNGNYPKLEAGTFEIGHSTSKWPSWTQTLGPELGKSLPVDPINEFNLPCVSDETENEKYDQGSCWNDADKNFICPEGSHIYQYVTEDAGQTYRLYVNMEYEEHDWANMDANWVKDNSCQDFSIGP